MTDKFPDISAIFCSHTWISHMNESNQETIIDQKSWNAVDRNINNIYWQIEFSNKITSEGPTSQWKKGTVNAALNSAAHLVGGNSFLNCNKVIKLTLET
jgi:hypothetical protein